MMRGKRSSEWDSRFGSGGNKDPLHTLSQNSLAKEASLQLPGDCAKALARADALQDDACL